MRLKKQGLGEEEEAPDDGQDEVGERDPKVGDWLGHMVSEVLKRVHIERLQG